MVSWTPSVYFRMLLILQMKKLSENYLSKSKQLVAVGTSSHVSSFQDKAIKNHCKVISAM